MDIGMLHSHHLLGVLLLLLVGTPLVLKRNPRWLQITRRVIEILLLLTGLYLIIKAPGAWSSAYVLKYILIILAIGLSIAAGRLQKPLWTLGAFLLLVYVYGLSVQRDILLRSEEQRVRNVAVSPPSVEAGAQLYEQLCQRCHGREGKAHYQKAPSLHPIANPDTGYWAAVIRAGKGVMPGHPYLTEAQLQSLIAFLRRWQ
ncbi:MAG: cytochrome c [Bacteroidia bacterium]|nr:cytochrome c [Bacteroidia bacterium]